MIKKFVKHGNSHAIVVDRTIMELLQASPETPLKINVEGQALRVVPKRNFTAFDGENTLYCQEIELTCSDDSCAWRIARVNNVIGYVHALAEHYGNEDILTKVAKLEDWKGDLTVTWRSNPTEGEMELFVKAWQSRIGDGADNVHHEVPA